MDEVYGTALNLLKSALQYKTIRPVFDDTKETVRGLCDIGYMEPAGVGAFQITSLGRDYLKQKPSRNAPSPVRRRPGMVAPYSERKPTQTPEPVGVKKVMHPVKFSKLSARQQNMLRFIDRYIKDVCYPPTVREIGEKVGISSTSVVSYNIERLILAGWLERADGISRGIRLAQELPGSKTSRGIQTDHGVLRIAINLTGEPPQNVITAAQDAIERLQGVIAAAREEATS